MPRGVYNRNEITDKKFIQSIQQKRIENLELQIVNYKNALMEHQATIDCLRWTIREFIKPSNQNIQTLTNWKDK